MKKNPNSAWVALIAFVVGFLICHLLADRRITSFAERIRLNEVRFVAIDADSGERITPSTGYSSRGLFGSVSLPGVMRWDGSGEFEMIWVDIEGMDGYILPYVGGGRYTRIGLKDLATTTPLISGGSLLDPIELRLERVAQQTDDGNAETPPGEGRTQ